MNERSFIMMVRLIVVNPLLSPLEGGNNITCYICVICALTLILSLRRKREMFF
jgi:hypothetical protein